jgi:hypothetical protein
MKVSLKPKGRKVYGRPLSKKFSGDGAPVDITAEVLQEIGEAILDSVKHEARIEIAKHMNKPTRDGGGDMPAYIRDMKSFLAMLKVRVSGKSSIEIYLAEDKRKERVGTRLHTVNPFHHRFISSNPKDQEPFVMGTLKSRVGKTVPIVELDGEVVFRVVLPNAAWVHPGFMKYTFLERGIEKGKAKAAGIIRERVIVPLIASGAFFS